ncbi:MAG: hypothetical protein ABJM06_03630 [Gilvibacter sp.]
MRLIAILALMFSTALSFGQNKNIDANNTSNTNTLRSFAANPGQEAQFTGQATFFNPKFDREGSIYLFDGWDQSAIIFPKGVSNGFTERQMNFNIQRSLFETRIKGDSIKAFNFASIEKIIVDGRTFKSFYFEELQREKIFEVVYRGKDFTILKGYTVDILEASANPMLARPRDKYIQRVTYYMETDTELREFKLKKKAILSRLDATSASKAKEYAKKYDKSFTNEDELRMILNYATR